MIFAHEFIRRVAGGRCFYAALAFGMALAACSEQEKISPVQGNCADLFIARDYTKIGLLEYHQRENKLGFVLQAEPAGKP